MSVTRERSCRPHRRVRPWTILHPSVPADTLAGADAQNFLDDYEEAPPDPVTLFTVLYGIYPRNFAAFIRDATAYLREKGWKGATGDGTIDLVSGVVREKSEVR